MPNTSLAPELIEAYALAPSGLGVINTMELRHISISEPIYLVQGFLNREITVDSVVKEFLAVPFNFTLPSTDDGGLQELNITIDNVGNSVSDFCEMALEFSAPVQIIYRTYLPSDLTQCLNDPPLRLFLLDVQITLTQVTGRAVPVDFLNLQFPNEDYTRTRFPGLGDS